MNDGIEIILARMETHPEEFYDDSGKWKFMYKEYFRDVMTEEEKAALHTKLKQVRRTELTSKVMDIMSDKMIGTPEGYIVKPSEFGSAPMKQQGAGVSCDSGAGSWGNNGAVTGTIATPIAGVTQTP